MTITLNRADKKNAITAAMADALQKAADDAAIRVVVLQGHETIFCTGNDTGNFLDRPPTTKESPVYRFLHSIAEFARPLTATVCGAAVGIGTTMLLHCDLVYAGDSATFSLHFVNLGLCPEAASSLLMPQMLGYHRAAEMLLFGEPIKADVALAMGLANRVVLSTEVNALARTRVRKLVSKPMSWLLEIKRLMKKGQASHVAQQMDNEGVSFARMLQEPAAWGAYGVYGKTLAGFFAILEHRPARYIQRA